MKTIIFDFDGTIADTLPWIRKKLLFFIKEMRLSDLPDHEIIREIRSKSYSTLMKEFKISWLKLPFIMAKVYQAQKELYEHIDEIKIYPQIKELLETLHKKGYCLSILSSNIRQNIDSLLKKHKIDFFDFIYCERNIFGKDRVLRKILKEEGLKKEEAFYVGDEIRDIEASHKAGIKIIAVSWGFNSRQALIKNNCDFIADKSMDIISYL